MALPPSMSWLAPRAVSALNGAVPLAVDFPMPTIRPLTTTDVEAFIALRREALADTPWAFCASPEDDRTADEIRAAIAHPDSDAIIGAVDAAKSDAGRLLAVAGLHRLPRAKEHHRALIWGVYVTPAARSAGLGRAVVSSAINAAREWLGVTSINLSCSENSPEARALYESLGFKVWGVEPDALRIDHRPYAEVHMQLAVEGAILP